MKKILNFLAVALLAVVAVHVGEVFGIGSAAGVALAAAPVFASFANLRNITEQVANPAGIRRIGIIAVRDLLDEVIDWPTAVGEDPDIDQETMEVTTAVPLKVGKTIAVITPADNSAFADFENQGDRYYQSYKHAMGLELAGQTQVQSIEMRKHVNTGGIYFTETNDGVIRVYGSKLSPIVLKSKGASGKKGGDKRGYTLTGDSDNFMTEPPFYPSTLALPGMTSAVGGE
jgi:hypothetical protein